MSWQRLPQEAKACKFRVLLKLADTVLILINTGPSNVKQKIEFKFVFCFQLCRLYMVHNNEFFGTCNVLPFNCTHLALWRGKGQGKRPKVHAKQKGFKNFFSPECI